MKIQIEKKGLNLNNDNDIILITLEEILYYDKISFLAQINMETEETFFERNENNILEINIHESVNEANIEVVFDIIENSRHLWFSTINNSIKI